MVSLYSSGWIRGAIYGWKQYLHILSSDFNWKITPNIISCSRQKSTERHVVMGKCRKKLRFFLKKKQADPSKKNDYTTILVIFAAIAWNNGKFAGLVRLQMWSDSADLFVCCFLLSEPFVWHPNHARSSLCRGCILVESWSELANVEKRLILRELFHRWNSVLAARQGASPLPLMLLFWLVPVPRNFEKVSNV